MKKNFIKSMAVALFAMISGNAFADGFSIDPIEVEPGSTTKVTVNADFQESDGIASLEFKLYLPEGFSIAKKKNGKFNIIEAGQIAEDELDWTYEVSEEEVDGSKFIFFVCYSNDWIGGSGEFIEFNLVVDESVAGGEYNIPIADQVYTVSPDADSNPGKAYTPEDYNWVVTVPGAVEEGAKVNISASGRTVYYDEAKSLDFSSLTDVTAWVVVNATASKVYTKQVEKVPAMTAVIVEGPASTEVTIPYTTEEVEAPEANILTPITESFVIDDSNYGKIYILSGGVFKKAKNGLTMPVGKAYFELPEATARIANEELEIVNGEATGIQNVNVENENAPVYNLNGVRVNKLQKGVYIQNGHKFIVK